MKKYIDILEIYILILVAVKLYTFVKTHKAGHLKWVNFTVRKLFLNKQL